jgi:outer membrane protein OmpA-like peptidoglycan-associated protein
MMAMVAAAILFSCQRKPAEQQEKTIEQEIQEMLSQPGMPLINDPTAADAQQNRGRFLSGGVSDQLAQLLSAGEDPAGQVFRFKSIIFPDGENSLSEQGANLREIDELAQLLQSTPDLQIEVTGHADHPDNRDNNIQRFALHRALFVKDRLVRLGVVPNQVKITGVAVPNPAPGENGNRLELRVR